MDQTNSPALKQAAEAYLNSLLRGLPTEESLAESLVLSQRFDQPAQSDAASSSPVQSSDIADHFPKYLPEGYKVAEQMTLIGFVQIIYANESGRELIFIKQDKSGLQIGIDTEGIQTETVEVNLSQGIFYANKGQSNLIWSDGRFAYSIIGILTKEELIKMASSIN